MASKVRPLSIDKRKRRLLVKQVGKQQCKEMLISGRQCPNGPLYVEVWNESTGKWDIKRLKWCNAHCPPEWLERLGMSRFGKKTSTSGRKARPPLAPYKVMRELVEEHIMDVLKPYIEALAAEKEVVVGHGRHARVEKVPDHRARLQAAESLFDRVYGKPKQTTELAGGISLEPVEVPRDKDRELEVAKILAQAGAVSPQAAAEETIKRAAKAKQN